jgi:hypothetical protein
MRQVSLLFLVVVEVFERQTTSCHAFLPSKTSSRSNASTPSSFWVLSLSSAAEESTLTASGGIQKKPLSPKEILARQREKQGLLDEDVYPKLFEDDLLDDMQQILLTLEKRVKEGPGSLTTLEVEHFVSKSQSILTEMKEKEYSRLQDAGSSSTASTTTSAALAAKPPMAPTAVEVTPAIPAAQSQVEIHESKEATQSENLEDGPAYSPDGGNGSLARGTVNTYVIPNMDEMSPEEYQKALQESISERQRKRVASGQQYGNRATWNYLNNLSGDSGVLKATKSEDQD